MGFQIIKTRKSRIYSFAGKNSDILKRDSAGRGGFDDGSVVRPGDGNEVEVVEVACQLK